MFLISRIKVFVLHLYQTKEKPMRAIITYFKNYKIINSIKPYKTVRLDTGLLVDHYRDGRIVANRMITNGYEHSCR